MGWMGRSLDKMVYKQKIETLENRLSRITAELNQKYEEGAFAQQVLGAQKSNYLLANRAAQASAVANLGNGTASAANGANATNGGNNANASTASTIPYESIITGNIDSSYLTNLQNIGLTATYRDMMINSIFSQKEQALSETIGQEETQLELEQEQVQTQLQEARAVYQSLEQAVSQDIQSGAPKYTA